MCSAFPARVLVSLVQHAAHHDQPTTSLCENYNENYHDICTTAAGRRCLVTHLYDEQSCSPEVSVPEQTSHGCVTTVGNCNMGVQLSNLYA